MAWVTKNLQISKISGLKILNKASHYQTAIESFCLPVKTVKGRCTFWHLALNSHLHVHDDWHLKTSFNSCPFLVEDLICNQATTKTQAIEFLLQINQAAKPGELKVLIDLSHLHV